MPTSLPMQGAGRLRPGDAVGGASPGRRSVRPLAGGLPVPQSNSRPIPRRLSAPRHAPPTPRRQFILGRKRRARDPSGATRSARGPPRLRGPHQNPAGPPPASRSRHPSGNSPDPSQTFFHPRQLPQPPVQQAVTACSSPTPYRVGAPDCARWPKVAGLVFSGHPRLHHRSASPRFSPLAAHQAGAVEHRNLARTSAGSSPCFHPSFLGENLLRPGGDNYNLAGTLAGSPA